MPKLPAQITVQDKGGHLAVLIERGHGWELALTTPTHRGAQYQEAREQGMAEARQAVADKVNNYRAIYDVTEV